MKRPLVFVVLVLLSFGCASPAPTVKTEKLNVPKIPDRYVDQFRNNTRGLEFGMTCEQAERLLGPPGANVASSQYITWFWAFGPHGLCCHFQQTTNGFALQSWTFTD